MTTPTRSDLDPFCIIIGVVASRRDSDLLVSAATAAGLRFDPTLVGPDAYSHSTRVRVLVPRIMAAYNTLSDEAQMIAARLALMNFGAAFPNTQNKAVETLRRAGWEVRGDDLVVGSQDVREMFFPKGSQWDAHVVLSAVLKEATSTLTIVDAYADTTIFQMLTARSVTGLTVRILCSHKGPSVAAEAKAFTKQHPGVVVTVRQTEDFHDRFVVVDNQSCVHVGASIKDAGKTAFMVSRIEDPVNLSAMLTALDASWEAATQLP